MLDLPYDIDFSLGELSNLRESQEQEQQSMITLLDAGTAPSGDKYKYHTGRLNNNRFYIRDCKTTNQIINEFPEVEIGFDKICSR